MPRASVTRIHPDAKPEMVAIQLPGDVAIGAAKRFFGVEAVIRNAATVLEGDPTADALEWIADEVKRLYVDLDICAWPRPATQDEAQS